MGHPHSKHHTALRLISSIAVRVCTISPHSMTSHLHPFKTDQRSKYCQYGHSPPRFFELEQTPSRIQESFCVQGLIFSGESAQDELIYSLLCRWHHQVPCTQLHRQHAQTHLEFSIMHSLSLCFSELSFHLCIILQMKGIFGALTLWINQHQTECKGIIWIMHTWKKTAKKKGCTQAFEAEIGDAF